jgi:VanZ family protein
MQRFIIFLNAHWLYVTAIILFSITVLSLSPLDELPPAPGSDKLHHLIAYAALTFPLILRKPRYWGLFLCFFLAYSGLIELIQPYVNRYGEWADMLANSLGIFIGLLLAELLNYFFPVKLQQSHQQE